MNPNRATSTLLGIGWIAALSPCSCGSPAGDLFGSGNAAAALSDPVSTASLAADPLFEAQLPIPPLLAPTSRDAGTDYYDITIRSGSAQMRAGASTAIVGFDGITPGPTILATRGRTVQITQTNAWTENVSIHNHGHKVAAASDGHPTDYIAPGSSKVYTYPNDQNAGTYWYHDHTLDLTGPHVYQGLAGFYIIRDPKEDALKLPSGNYDIPLLIQDKRFNADNSLSYEPGSLLGFLGDTAVVNGAVTPYLDVSTRQFRFRVLNGSNARPLALQLRVAGSSTVEPFQVIASDGGLLPSPIEVSVLPVAPAERYDIVVDFAPYPVGTEIELISTDPRWAFANSYSGEVYDGGYAGTRGRPGWTGAGGPGWSGYGGPGYGGPGYGGPGYASGGPGWGGHGGPNGSDVGWSDGTLWIGSEEVPVLTDLMQFVVAYSEPDPRPLRSELVDLQRLELADAVGTQQIVFRLDGEDWTVNGLSYDPDRTDVSSELDQVYVWSVTNESPIPHPFHKHLSAFNVLDINGQAPPSFASGWKDTVMVPPFSTVRILFKDETFSGTYVFQSHNLELEDHGLILQERVGN